MSTLKRVTPPILVLLSIALAVPLTGAPPRRSTRSAPRFQTSSAAAFPLIFEENAGQADGAVQFVSRASGYTLFLTRDAAVYRMRGSADTPGTAARMVWSGRASNARFAPDAEPLSSFSNYFLGNDKSKWRTGVRHYARVRARSVYKDVDLVFYSTTERRHEFDLLVHPGADASTIALRWEGVESIRQQPDGSLALKTPAGDLIQRKPRVYQPIAGRQVPIEASYRIEHASSEIRFALGRYDRSQPLVIDPIVERASYIGGALADSITAVAKGVSDSVAYFAGTTESANFPTQNSIDNTRNGTTDAVACSCNPELTILNWCSYFGGDGVDRGKDIDVGANGLIYLTNYTESANYPVLNAADGTLGGGADYAITAIRAEGIPTPLIAWSTYVGGTANEFDLRTASKPTGVRDDGSVVCTALPSLSADAPTHALAADRTANGGLDIYVSCFSDTGTFTTGTYVGTSAFQYPIALEVAGNGTVLVLSEESATSPGDYYPSVLEGPGGGADVLIQRLTPDLSKVLFSTRIGGSTNDSPTGLALGPFDAIYYLANTSGTDYPVGPIAHNTAPEGGTDAIVGRVNTLGRQNNATRYGGSAEDTGSAIAVGQNQVCIAGDTTSTDLETTPDAFDSSSSPTDAFFACFLQAAVLTYATIYGENAADIFRGLEFLNFAYFVSGSTDSSNLRQTLGSLDPSFNGGADGLLLRMKFDEAASCLLDVTPSVREFFDLRAISNFQLRLTRNCQWIAVPATPAEEVSTFNVQPLGGSTNATISYDSQLPSIPQPLIESVAITDNASVLYHLLLRRQQSAAPQTFEDVPPTHLFSVYIEMLRALQITSGCAANRYCPSDLVTRGQMAVFIIRSIFGGDNFVFREEPYFTDVPSTHPFFKWIQAMRELGITSGCAADRYCPDDSVTRGQMAVFIMRGIAGNRLSFALSNAFFNDVPVTHPFFTVIQAMKMAGITSGTGADQYSPDAPVTREQMAAFLIRGFRAPH